MWMSYVKYTEIVDLKTGVENLSEQFSNLAWDARHESIYGMNRFCSYEECEKLAESYINASNICNDYLKGTIGIEILVNQLKIMEFDSFLRDLKDVLPVTLQHDSSDSEEEEDRKEEKKILKM